MNGVRRVVGMVALAAVALSSCVTGDWTGDPEDPSVVVIGDSLVFQAERLALATGLTLVTDDLVAADHQGYVTGWIGSTVAQGYGDAWNDPTRQGVIPDVLVIALGTNDSLVLPSTGQPRVTPEEARPLIAAWLAEVPAGCVRLIGVAESVWGWGLDVTGPPWNQMLAEEAAVHANAEFVAWEPDLAWVAGGADPHMNAAGKAAYRSLIVNAALDCAA